MKLKMEGLCASADTAPSVALEYLWQITVTATPAESADTPSSRKNKGPWGSMDILEASGNPFLKKKGVSSPKKGVADSL